MKTVLITGASSGIGLELAKIYARNKFNIIGVSSNKEKLENLKKEILKKIGNKRDEKDEGSDKIKIELFAIDLSKEKSSYKLYEEIKKRNIKVDIVINNAGIGIFKSFSEYDKEIMEKNDKMINLNIKALVEITKLFLDDMIENKSGAILNVASTASFQPGPLMSTYYASKAFVLSFTEAVREELRNEGLHKKIKISTLCPGPTKTEFEKSKSLDENTFFSKFLSMEPEKVAKIAYKEFSKGKNIIIPGIGNKIGVFATRIIPRNTMLKITRRIQEKKKD